MGKKVPIKSRKKKRVKSSLDLGAHPFPPCRDCFVDLRDMSSRPLPPVRRLRGCFVDLRDMHFKIQEYKGKVVTADQENNSEKQVSPSSPACRECYVDLRDVLVEHPGCLKENQKENKNLKKSQDSKKKVKRKTAKVKNSKVLRVLEDATNLRKLDDDEPPKGIEALISRDLEETRKKNIAENKAFLAKIMADIKDSDLNLWGKKRRVSTPRPRKPVTPRVLQEGEEGSRPVTRQRRRTIMNADGTAEDPVSAPPSPTDENNNLTVKFKFGRKKRREVSYNEEGSPKKRKIDPDEINLDEVSYKVSEKVYDTYNGTSCHQCRQKTIDQKTICKSESCVGVRGQFCGVCLKNRYGEDAREALEDENWMCPPCRGICNCSICRNRHGICPTGVLIHIANAKGFPDVNSYLQSLNDDYEDDESDDEDEDEDEDKENEMENGEKENKKIVEVEMENGKEEEEKAER